MTTGFSARRAPATCAKTAIRFLTSPDDIHLPRQNTLSFFATNFQKMVRPNFGISSVHVLSDVVEILHSILSIALNIVIEIAEVQQIPRKSLVLWRADELSRGKKTEKRQKNKTGKTCDFVYGLL